MSFLVEVCPDVDTLASLVFRNPYGANILYDVMAPNQARYKECYSSLIWGHLVLNLHTSTAPFRWPHLFRGLGLANGAT